MHRYLYAYSNPARYTDPTGHAAQQANADLWGNPVNQTHIDGSNAGATPDSPKSTTSSSGPNNKPKFTCQDKTGRAGYARTPTPGTCDVDGGPQPVEAKQEAGQVFVLNTSSPKDVVTLLTRRGEMVLVTPEASGSPEVQKLLAEGAVVLPQITAETLQQSLLSAHETSSARLERLLAEAEQMRQQDYEDGLAAEAAHDKKVGEWDNMPGVGPGLHSYNYAKEHKWGKAIFFGVVAVTDVNVLKALAKGGVKLGVRLLGPKAGARLGTEALVEGGAKAATEAARGAPEYVNLASAEKTQHILYGDKTGGGHLFPGKAGKSPFPQDWSADRVMHEISDVATDPALKAVPGRGGRSLVQGTRDGIDITVVLESSKKGGGIVTGFPTNVPRNP